MAINTLKGVSEIDGHEVFELSENDETGDCYESQKEFLLKFPILVDHEDDIIAFKMMTKPASEGGRGCQFTTLIETALIMLKHLDEKFPCEENRQTINNLALAIEWQHHRTTNRESRGVEGFDKA